MHPLKDTGEQNAPHSRWKGRWICIGGGTSGLGEVLAQQFARRGANVALVGRDHDRGQAAIDRLRREHGGEFVFYAVDLADEKSIVGSEWERWLNTVDLDVAIAAAGKSDRGYLLQLSVGEIDSLMRANVTTSFGFSKATAGALRRRSGTLVHIASLAGIVAAPGLGGYALAKHAVVAMSRQLRIELMGQGIRVLLVCPGPIARLDDTRGRYDELVEQRKLPDSLKKPAAGAKLKAIDPEQLSERVIAAVESRRKELILPNKVRWLAGLGTLWPWLLDYALRQSNRREG